MLDIRYGRSGTPVPTKCQLTAVGEGILDRPLPCKRDDVGIIPYPKIQYYVVLAYVPHNKERLGLKDGDSTIYPECLDKTPPKYAIIKRNRWMLERADFVITYVTHITGGAAEFKHLAERKGKKVINLDIRR